MKTNHKIIRALALIIPLALAVAILACATPILQPKYITASPEGSLTEEYYNSVKETKHDVLFIGDCEVYESFVPAVLWQEYGISSYVRGGAQQLVWHSYYMLEDALRYETPKIVVFNVLALKYGEPQKEAYNRLALDGMEWSSVKVKAINASMMEEESLASYVWPLLRYHSRWNELTAEDLKYAFEDKPAVSDSGYLMQTDIVPEDPSGEAPSPLIDPTLPATAMAYLDRMTALCKEKGIELILIKAPTNAVAYHWYDEWDAQIVSYAEENGLAYYNFIPKADEIGIDMSTDTYDAGVHLNVYGAEKLTKYFGKILKEAHSAPDRRDDAVLSAVWDSRVSAYSERKMQKAEISQNKNPS
ncbi:MAG: SGNH/GDSL hydrolase family protein [Clostridia bacterium]|nr:SGNH/GDSL hydrolase family protein [Clostridia bacterium]